MTDMKTYQTKGVAHKNVVQSHPLEIVNFFLLGHGTSTLDGLPVCPREGKEVFVV